MERDAILCHEWTFTESGQKSRLLGGDSIDIFLTQALTISLASAFLNAPLTSSLTQALNFKCLLNCTPGLVDFYLREQVYTLQLSHWSNEFVDDLLIKITVPKVVW